MKLPPLNASEDDEEVAEIDDPEVEIAVPIPEQQSGNLLEWSNMTHDLETQRDVNQFTDDALQHCSILIVFVPCLL